MSERQAQAILYGLALGDALGYPVEFESLQKIKLEYGPQGIQEPPDPALFSDDTQMTVALAQGLIDAGNAGLERILDAVSRRFVEWRNSPENNRAPGLTCMSAVRNIERGVHWRQAGVPGSKGCGSAMRVAPVGYLYQHLPDRLREIAEATSLATHGHPTATAASIAAAYLVKLALDGEEPSSYLNRVFVFTEGLSDEFEQALRRVGQVLGWGDEEAAMQRIGSGWVAEEAVGLALYCVMRYPDDYTSAVRRAANCDGDSDSVACIAGGIAGARLGLDAISADWRARCEHSEYLAELGSRLAASRQML